MSKDVASGKSALDQLGFVAAKEVTDPYSQPMSTEAMEKMCPPITPRGFNPIKAALYEEGGVTIDADRVFLPSFDSDEVLCKNCKHGLVIKSYHAGNRKADGTPFTQVVGFCNAGPEQVQLDDFRPIECSGFKAKKKAKK